MRYLSVCAGIEAATVAWHNMGWSPVAFSEIDAFPSAVLREHYPHVPNWGDMKRFYEWPDADVDLLVGGTPCQSFSVAGLRKGLADPRGNLALTYLAIAHKYRPQWVVWENVPGVLSSAGGRDFGAFLGGLGQLGYGWAYRVLDAQYFRLAQRRRRVFVVGCLGSWQRAAAVLFERHSLSGHPAPSRKKRETAPTLSSRRSAGGGVRTDEDCDGAVITMPSTGEVAYCLNAGAMGRIDYKSETMIATAFDWQSGGDTRGVRLQARPSLQACQTPAVLLPQAVRRLTPRECERLQGFPDDYTLITYRGKPAADGPRYKALGNSMAVPVIRWIGRRIQEVVQ